MTAASPRPALLAAFLLALAAGCGRESDGRVVLDLVEALPTAEVLTETATVVFGDPKSRRHLVSGFSIDEGDQDGETFVWGLGGESRLRFTVLRSRSLVAELQARPADGIRNQEVRVLLNGEEIGKLQLSPGPSLYQLPLTAGRLREGENVLSFRYRVARPPGKGDRRELAVAWYRLVVRGEHAPTVVAPLTRGEALVLPADAQVDYYLLLPMDSELRLGGYTVEGSVHIGLEGDDLKPRDVAVLADRGGAISFPLPVAQEQVVRLRVRNRGGPAVLEAPRVFSSAAVTTAQPAQGPLPIPRRPLASRANVLIYLVDTLRADRLGAYGSDGGMTPRLDAFAASAVLFERAVAQSSWTRSSVASLFTGLWPVSHGTNGRRDALAAEATTLAEVLRDAGYATAAVVTNPNLHRRFGLDQGFDEYLQVSGTAPPREVRSAAFGWLDRERADRPFLLYVHTVEPHDPYEPPPDLRRRFAASVPLQMAGTPGRNQEASPELVDAYSSLYDAEVAWSDRAFGRILDGLRERGLEDGTLVVFLSDHGEEFQEHGGWKHGTTLHGELLDIPLVIGGPGLEAGRRISEPVQQVDLLPTILDYLGIETPHGIEGRSLLPALIGAASGLASPPVFSYLDLDGTPRASIVSGEWKLIQQRVEGEVTNVRLYQWTTDPGETRDLSSTHPVLASYLGSMVTARLRVLPPWRAEEVVLEEELEESLRALGYL